MTLLSLVWVSNNGQTLVVGQQLAIGQQNRLGIRHLFFIFIIYNNKQQLLTESQNWIYYSTNYRDRNVNSTSMSWIVTIPIWRVAPSATLYVVQNYIIQLSWPNLSVWVGRAGVWGQLGLDWPQIGSKFGSLHGLCKLHYLSIFTTAGIFFPKA